MQALASAPNPLRTGEPKGEGEYMLKFGSGLLGLVLAVVIFAPSGTAQPSPTTWNVAIGGETPGHGVQAQIFAPGTITINAGDTVRWTTTPVFDHTVTFLSGAKLPPLGIPENDGKLLFNPLVALPQGLATYAGKGVASSWLLMGKDKSYSLTFTKPGSYAYLFLLHPGMVGTVIVQPPGSPLPMTQAAYDKRAAEQVSAALRKGEALLASAKLTVSKGAKGTVYTTPMAGSLVSHASVIRFVPETITVKAGDTIRWAMKDPIELHTVTFSGTDQPPDFVVPQPQPKGPPKIYFNTKAAFPGGGAVHKSDGYYNSGFMDLRGRVPKTYAVTFTKPGTYTYWCVVHVPQGMKGTVIVK
jgi:plastocyanin